MGLSVGVVFDVVDKCTLHSNSVSMQELAVATPHLTLTSPNAYLCRKPVALGGSRAPEQRHACWATVAGPQRRKCRAWEQKSSRAWKTDQMEKAAKHSGA